MTGTHLNKLGTQQKKRIYFEVSEEAATMWEEIVSHKRILEITNSGKIAIGGDYKKRRE
ncbi:hypothetical protein ACH5RX_002584 [Enterococcus faecalis]